jgi:hypothetical protein
MVSLRCLSGYTLCEAEGKNKMVGRDHPCRIDSTQLLASGSNIVRILLFRPVELSNESSLIWPTSSSIIPYDMLDVNSKWPFGNR